jgi:hypothetical protein
VVHPTLRKAGRFVNPTGLVLAGLCFALPFATVACDAPGGYGRAAPGGTTEYTGFGLVFGAEPRVQPPDKVLPPERARSARLYPQPAAGVVLVLLVAGVGVAVRMKDPRVRRASVAVISGVAVTALLVNQALVESELAVRLGDQNPVLPTDKTLRDYVHTGLGFIAVLVLLLLIAGVNLVGWWSRRPRPAIVSTEEDRR